MSGAWFWFDIVLFLVLSSCQKWSMVGGTGRKEKENTFIFVYTRMITLRKQRQLLFFIVIIIIIIIFVYLVGWGVKGKSVGLT